MTHGRLIHGITLGIALIFAGTNAFGQGSSPGAPSSSGSATGGSSTGSASQSGGSASSGGQSQSMSSSSTQGGSGQSSTGSSSSAGSDGFQGSVPEGTATSTPIQLTFLDAINRGLRNNLGLLTSEQADRTSQSQRIRALSVLLPNVSGQVSQVNNQVNLATFGISLPANSPVQIPTIVGPFSYGQALAQASIPVFNLQNIRNFQASKRRLNAADLSIKDARDMVVQAVGNAYLQIISAGARVDATKAAVNTAQISYDRAVNQKKAGTSPGIDVIRAQVELKRQQQTLLSQSNDFEKNKLTLGRVIGLPLGQAFTVADPTPNVPMESVALDDAMKKALDNRADYRSAEVQVHATELAKRAAKSQWFPRLDINGNYGASGRRLFTSSHGIYSVQGTLSFYVFTGGRIKADVLQQDAQLMNDRNNLANLRGRIDYEVRSALLDLKSSQDQVDVARSNTQLANQEVTQANDRFAAGVTDNLEVVQAQQTLADANQNLISALYQNNLAKVALARALGLAEQGIRAYFATNNANDLTAPAPSKR